MKKNLLSILILALLIVNIVLTSIMMFSVTGASKKTAALVTDIASVLQLEIGGTGASAEAEAEAIPMSQTSVYPIEEPLTIALQNSDDGKEHWCVLSVTFSNNTKDKAFKEYGAPETMVTYVPLITSEITDIIGKYKMEDLKDSAVQDEAKAQILSRVQTMFDSQFIYKVSFSDIKFQ